MPTEHAPRMAPTPGCSFVARQDFELGGRKFAAGDPFPFAELGWTEDAAWNFWRSAMINVGPAPAPALVAPAPVKPPPPKHYNSRR